MNEIMEFMEDLKELVHKGEQIAQQMQQGGNFGQRRSYGHYGMRGDQSGYGGGSGGNYGQRWHEPMQGHYPPMQGGYPNQQWPDVNPMMFM